MVVYFADHLAHSIQVDAIGKRVEQDTLTVAAVLPDDPARWAALSEQADLILDDVTAQPADTLAVRAATRDLQATITAHRPANRE